MNRISIKVPLLAALTLASAMVLAAEPGQPAKPAVNMQGKGGMQMRGGMMDAEHHMGGDMMGMMRSCQAMMGGTAMSGGAAMPKLPPGNEKIEFQMHAEMMQKMGEIAAKYADKIKEGK